MSRKTYAIKEIFESFQGEGFWTGTPALFIRFAGCNLACSFCDTDFSGGTAMNIDEILDEIRKTLGIYPTLTKDENAVPILPREDPHTVPTHIVLTGGEPGIQVDSDFILAIRSLFGGYGIKVRIAIETNGTRELPGNIDWVTLSPKTAHEYSSESVILESVTSKARVSGELKFVLDAVCDFSEYVTRNSGFDHVYLSPIMEGITIPSQNISRCIYYLQRNPTWRLSLQTHKFVGAR